MDGDHGFGVAGDPQDDTDGGFDHGSLTTTVVATAIVGLVAPGSGGWPPNRLLN